MNGTLQDALDLVDGLRESWPPTSAEVFVAPSFTALRPVGERLEGSPIGLGAQNMYYQPQGAFTGEISPPMLKDCGCRYVILGHSERRHVFKEDDALINRKVEAALDHGLEVVFCVGERRKERRAGDTKEVVVHQLAAGLEGISADRLRRVNIAYEPVWAIGTGDNATPEEAQEVHACIRDWVREKFGAGAAAALRIIYGGSVSPKNAGDLMACPDLDGVLVGTASLDAQAFCAIISTVL